MFLKVPAQIVAAVVYVWDEAGGVTNCNLNHSLLKLAFFDQVIPLVRIGNYL